MIEHDFRPEYLVISRKYFTASGEKFLSDIVPPDLPVYECDAKRFSRLTDTVHSQGFLAVVKGDVFSRNDKIPESARLIVYLDGINDPGNLGTIIRTSAALGVDLLAISSNTVDFSNPKTIRASAGLIFRVPLKKVEFPETFFDELESNKIELWGSDADADIDLTTIAFGGKVCLAIGAEATGLSSLTKKKCQKLFKIGTMPAVESLNAAVAAGIAIHHVAARMELV